MDVLDARRGRITVLTPHDGEFVRIGGDLSYGDRVGTARAFAAEHGCVLVLKGHRTVTAVPAGNALVNTTGTSALAKGGSGDVLTGVIASLLAQGAPAPSGGGRGRVAPRPGGRDRGGEADGLRRHAGGRGRRPAGGHRRGPGLRFSSRRFFRCADGCAYQ